MTNPPAPKSGPAPWYLRIPAGAYWTALALILLLAVVGYDRRESTAGRNRMQEAAALAEAGRYDAALEEYKLALANRRMGSRLRAECAVRIGEMYAQQFEDYESATDYFVRARALHPQSVKSEPTAALMEMAMARSRGSGRVREVVDSDRKTIIQRVELLERPAADIRGDVLIQIDDMNLHGGEVERVLSRTLDYRAAIQSDTLSEFRQVVREYAARSLFYRAAIDAELHKDPDVSQRLFDFQRDLLAERYLARLRDQANVVTTEAVAEYFEANRDRFRQPGRIGVAAMKLGNAEDAEKAMARLRAGDDFTAVVREDSLLTDTLQRLGFIGFVSDQDTLIPYVGDDKALVEALFRMSVNDVSSITQIGGAYYIFKVTSNVPRRESTLDEVRPQIEAVLRRQQSEKLLEQELARLRETYHYEMDDDAIRAHWVAAREALRAPAAGDGATSPTETASTP